MPKPTTPTPPPANEADLDERLAQLEARLSRLEAHTDPQPTPDTPHASHDALSAIDPGEVVFAGKVFNLEYHWYATGAELLAAPWTEQLERLSALAHPLRAAILRRLLDSEVTVAELVAEELVSSPGTAYHHLAILENTAWITKTAGRYQLRPSRIIPLAAILSAAADH